MPNINAIIQATAEHFEITVADIIGPSRRAVFAKPRQLAMHISKKITQASTPKIGAKFGGRHHTTVCEAQAKVRSEMNDEMLIDISKIIQRAESIFTEEVREAKEYLTSYANDNLLKSIQF